MTGKMKNYTKAVPDEKKETKKELENKLISMREDREAKLAAAKDQLVDMLTVTVDKYRTATGTAEALRILRFVDESFNDIKLANNLAKDMASITSMMTAKARKLEPEEMDQLCDGFYDKDFTIGDSKAWPYELAKEMMCIDLCRNVGGAAEDMVSFVARSQEEIDATEQALKDLGD